MPNPKKIEELHDEYVSRSVRFPLINGELSHLMGEVLTVIDASIPDKIQNKAIKDILRQKFSNVIHDRFWWWCYGSSARDDINADLYLKGNIVEGKQKHSEVQYGGNEEEARLPIIDA